MLFDRFFKKQTVSKPLLGELNNIIKTARELEKKCVKDILVNISADESGSSNYLIKITNTGRKKYYNLRIIYEQVLLDAESFGIDTSRMREGRRIEGEPVLIDSLAPGESTQFVRKGWGTHERYDLSRNTGVGLEFGLDEKKASPTQKSWCSAVVDLPNAKY